MYDRSRDLFERSQKLIPGGVNSPVRAMRGFSELLAGRHDLGRVGPPGAAFREALARQHAFCDRAGCAAALAGLGGLARERADWARATALLAAAASLVGSDDLPAAGVEAPDYAADRAAARSALGDAAFALAWDAGRSLDPDITIRSALAEPTAAAS